MPKSTLVAAVAAARRVAQPPLSDGELLTRFINGHDEHAFAALVHRLGPMVLAVCRRVVGDAHLADDAFQAAFLVLARRADAVRPREALRGWVYGVAVRTAREARAMSARQRAREIPMARVPENVTELKTGVDADTLRALDEEIGRLPDLLRATVVLCEIHGSSRRDAAATFGIPEGTVSSRLAKARKLLAKGLRRRGVTLPAAGLAALLAQSAVPAAVPAALAEATVKLIGATTVAGGVATLATGILRMMLLQKLKWLALALALATTACLAAAIAQRSTETAAPASSATAASPEPPLGAAVPSNAGPTQIYFSRNGSLYVTDPDGKEERPIDLPAGAGGAAVLSRDGKSVAYWIADGEQPTRATLCVCAVNGKGPTVRFPLPEKIGFIDFLWSPDGSTLHVNTGTPGLRGVQHHTVDLKTKQMSLPWATLTTHLIMDWTADGKYFLTTEVGGGPDWMPRSLHLMNLDGSEHQRLTRPDDLATIGRLSHDGKRVLWLNHGRLQVMDVGNPASLTAVGGIPDGAEVVAFAWSPDDKRIAFVIGASRVQALADLANLESRLVVADADGRNPTVLRSDKGKLMTRVFWR